jgi:hypothetical protein
MFLMAGCPFLAEPSSVNRAELMYHHEMQIFRTAPVLPKALLRTSEVVSTADAIAISVTVYHWPEFI